MADIKLPILSMVSIANVAPHERFWAEFSTRYTKSDHLKHVLPNFETWGASEERRAHRAFNMTYTVYNKCKTEHHAKITEFNELLLKTAADCKVSDSRSTMNILRIKEYLNVIREKSNQYDTLVEQMKAIVTIKKEEDAAWKKHCVYKDFLLHSTKEIILDNGYKCYLFDKRYMDHRRELVNLIMTLIGLMVGLACSLLSNWNYDQESVYLAGASFALALVGLLIVYYIKEQLDDLGDISTCTRTVAYYLGYLPKYVYTSNPKKPEDVY